MLIVEPVIMSRCARMGGTRRKIDAADGAATHAKRKRAAPRPNKKAQALLVGFLERLKSFRVLDPACGSGNFLYLALLALKDLEHRVNLEAERWACSAVPQRRSAVLKGIEINPYAAELPA